jgi:hypothetical protein
MHEDEAKRLVLDEFRIWCTAREIKLPASRSLAIKFYFDHLEADRSDLLDFPSEAGKSQVVQAWLRNARSCR